MGRTLILMRGLPGSGKTFKARKIAESYGDSAVCLILATDDLYVDKDGVYRYRPELAGIAHRWNQSRMREACKTWPKLTSSYGKDLVIIIDNTNIGLYEMRPYVEIARQYDFEIRFEYPDAPWSNNLHECHSKNSHGVPLDTVERMALNYNPSENIEEILASIAPWEKGGS